MPTKTQASVEDLYHVPENRKAELVNGELQLMPPAGDLHGSAGAEILVSLHSYARRVGTGRAYGDNVGFMVELPNRGSFNPDVAYYVGPRTRGKFLEGAPAFAIEIRSEDDYGPVAERKMAAKWRDYFAAGTLVVWDVDVLREEVVRVYRAADPENPRVYHRGELAEAEPAVPGWTMPVEDLFL